MCVDVGRSCILVSIGGKNVMLDCGMHMGYNDEASVSRACHVTGPLRNVYVFNNNVYARTVTHAHTPTAEISRLFIHSRGREADGTSGLRHHQVCTHTLYTSHNTHTNTLLTFPPSLPASLPLSLPPSLPPSLPSPLATSTWTTVEPSPTSLRWWAMMALSS